MGAKKQYLAEFLVGAKLAASFRSTMAAANASLNRLKASAASAAAGIRKLAGAFSFLGGIFATYLAGNVIRKVFEGATEAAYAAEQRTRILTLEFGKNAYFIGKGANAVADQVERLKQFNEALDKQGVLSARHFEAIGVGLAKVGISPKAIADSSKALGGLLLRAKGVRATEEDAAQLGLMIGRSIKSGEARGLRTFQVNLSPEEKKIFKQKAQQSPQAALAYLLTFMKAYGKLNAEFAKTPTGRIQLFNKAMGDLSEHLGPELIKMLADMADGWREALPAIEPAIIGTMKQLGKAVGWAGQQVQDFIRESGKIDLGGAWKQVGTAAADLARALGVSMPEGSVGAMLARWTKGELQDVARLLQSMRKPMTELAEMQARMAGVPVTVGKDYATKHWFLGNQSWQQFWIGFSAGAENMQAKWAQLMVWIKQQWGEFIREIKSLGDIDWTFGFAAKWQAALEATRRLQRDFYGTVTAPPGTTPPGVPGHAMGGIVRRPMLSMVGERGPEAIIPLSGGRRAQGLLDYATRAIMGGSGATDMHVSFAPVITIYGNATESEQRAMDSRLRDLTRDFIAQFKAAQAQERRLSYESGYA